MSHLSDLNKYGLAARYSPARTAVCLGAIALLLQASNGCAGAGAPIGGFGYQLKSSCYKIDLEDRTGHLDAGSVIEATNYTDMRNEDVVIAMTGGDGGIGSCPQGAYKASIVFSDPNDSTRQSTPHEQNIVLIQDEQQPVFRESFSEVYAGTGGKPIGQPGEYGVRIEVNGTDGGTAAPTEWSLPTSYTTLDYIPSFAWDFSVHTTLLGGGWTIKRNWQLSYVGLASPLNFHGRWLWSSSLPSIGGGFEIFGPGAGATVNSAGSGGSVVIGGVFVHPLDIAIPDFGINIAAGVGIAVPAESGLAPTWVFGLSTISPYVKSK